MGKPVQITREAYELLLQQKREGYPIKRLASEPIMEKYGHLLKAAEAAAVPSGQPMGQGAAHKPPQGVDYRRTPLPEKEDALKHALSKKIPQAVFERWWEYKLDTNWRMPNGEMIGYWTKNLQKYWQNSPEYAELNQNQGGQQ
jgi:hypothetical protein